MYSPIDEIKNRLDIVEVIGSYIKLSKAGVNFRALCPFHSEKKPSFFVSPARQIWHCFGCGKGSDIFGFVREIEGVEFGDALRILAQKAGVELKPMKPESASWRTERQRLYEICELACRFFEKQLEESRVGKEAKEYLLNRGISQESIKKWRLGYSPESWQGLSDFLVSKGYKREEIVKAGLAIAKDIRENSREIRANSRDIYDRFRGRIIFPIFDLNSQVVGFGGRVFREKDKEEIAKYVNTPNTLLYDKSRVLYGLDRAKMEIRKKNESILVEGYTDVILASQAGYQNVVATSGTALTPYQLKILKRYSENLLTAFDMDIAGDTATKRGIDLAQSLGFNIKVILLPEDLDPADIISKNPKDWEKLLENSKSILDFYFETTFAKENPKTPEGKKAISKILLPIIKRIPNDIERSFWVQELAKRLEVKEEAVAEELKKVKLVEEHSLFSTLHSARVTEEIYGLEPEEIVNLPKKTRRELLEERLLMMILKSPQDVNLIEENKIPLFSPKAQEILINLKKDPNFRPEKFSRSPNESFEGRRESWSPEVLDYFNYLSLKAEVEEIEEKDILPEIQICLKEIQSTEIKNKLDAISKEIKMAEEEKDTKRVNDLAQKFKDIASGLANL